MVCPCCRTLSDTTVPLEHQEVTVCLLLEVAIQTGSLCSLLEWLLVAFQLSGKEDVPGDENKSEYTKGDGTSGSPQGPSSAPLLPVLRRFAGKQPTVNPVEEASIF